MAPLAPPFAAVLKRLYPTPQAVVQASELWRTSPALICRAECVRILARRAEFDALGVSLCCTVKEDLPGKDAGTPGEIDEFRKFWDQSIYLDEQRDFYKAIAGGAPRSSTLAGFLASLLNPFSSVKKNVDRSKGTAGNMTGEGFTHGGVYVIRKGAADGEAPVYAHEEVNLGDHPPTDDLIEACKRAAEVSKE